MVNWQQIDTVFLDMDGTLLDLHFDNFFWLDHLPKSFAAKQGISQDEAMEQLTPHFENLKGTLNWYCLDYWSDLLDVDITALKLEVDHKVAFRPHVPDFLEAVKNSGKRSVIITNAHRDSLKIKLKKTHLDTLVDRIISSHDYQTPKEEQSFWEQLKIDEPFENERTLFIDDSLSVLASAAKFGIKHLLSIYQPDSQQPKREIDDFNAIHHFDEIMPERDNADQTLLDR